MPSPEGELSGQLLQAEAVNLQLGGADAFAQVLTRGRLRALERSLDLSPPSASPSTDSFLTRFSRSSRERENILTDCSAKWVASGVGITILLGPGLAHAAVGMGEGANSHGSQVEWLFSLGLVLAAIIRRGGGGSRGTEDGQMGLGESPQGFARRRFFERLKAEGLAAPHHSLLGLLNEKIPRSLPELGNLSGASIRVGQVAPVLRELEEAGLVTSYSMDRQGRLFQITELGRKIHSLYHRFDRERLLKPLSRATIRRLGTGRWVSDQGLQNEVFAVLGEADFEREMNMLTRVGLVERRRHPNRFGVMEYRLSALGTEVLGKDREVVAILERILSEFPED